MCIYRNVMYMCVSDWLIDWICENPRSYRSGREIVREVITVETIRECWVCVVLCCVVSMRWLTENRVLWAKEEGGGREWVRGVELLISQTVPAFLLQLRVCINVIVGNLCSSPVPQLFSQLYHNFATWWFMSSKIIKSQGSTILFSSLTTSRVNKLWQR